MTLLELAGYLAAVAIGAVVSWWVKRWLDRRGG